MRVHDCFHKLRFDIGNDFPEVLKQQAHIFTLCMARSRAVCTQNRQLQSARSGNSILFREENERTDYRDTRSAKVCDGCKRVQSGFKKQTQQKSLKNIFTVMSECNKIAALFKCNVVQCPAPHFRTHSAWILFFAYVENNISNIRFAHFKINIVFLCEHFDSACILFNNAKVKHNSA